MFMSFEALGIASDFITMRELQRPEVDPCSTCIGACCMKGNGLELTPSEADYLAGQGTPLREVGKKEMSRQERRSVAPGKQVYELMEDCANLDPETRQCRDYENRPEACQDFEASTDRGSACSFKREAMAERVDAGIAFIPLSVGGRFDEMKSQNARSGNVWLASDR